MRGAEGAREPRARPDLLTVAFQALLVGAAYYLAARLGLRLALIAKNVTPLWPPTGIAVVAFLLLGRRVWPGVALAAFLVNVTITPSLLAAAATAAGNTIAPLAAAECFSPWTSARRSTGSETPLRSWSPRSSAC